MLSTRDQNYLLEGPCYRKRTANVLGEITLVVLTFHDLVLLNLRSSQVLSNAYRKALHSCQEKLPPSINVMSSMGISCALMLKLLDLNTTSGLALSRALLWQ